MDIREAVKKTSEDYGDTLKKLAGGVNCEESDSHTCKSKKSKIEKTGRTHLREIEQCLKVCEYIYNKLLKGDYIEKMINSYPFIYVSVDNDCPQVSLTPFTAGIYFPWDYQKKLYHSWATNLDNISICTTRMYKVTAYLTDKNWVIVDIDKVLEGMQNSIKALKLAYIRVFCKMKGISNIYTLNLHIEELQSVISEGEFISKSDSISEILPIF